MESFQSALTDTYLENPCQVLPNALWKTVNQLSQLQTAYQVIAGRVTALQAWDGDRLLVYWSRDRVNIPEMIPQVGDLSLVLVHQDHINRIPAQMFSQQRAFFRLICKSLDQQGDVVVPSGFHVVAVEPISEAQEVASFIDCCYPTIRPSQSTVLSWTEHPVFDPGLWVWVMDENRGVPAGLGIAELDQTIREGSLEWIQVHPDYRSRGIGKCIVRTLLSRLAGRATFASVAGEVANETNPQALYRRCGFSGSDIWWLFTSKEGDI